MKKQAIYDRIEIISLKLDKYVHHRLVQRKSFFEYDIEGLHSLILQEWFGKFNNQTKYGEKFEILFNGKHWKTKDPTPQWIFWEMVNKGKVKHYVVRNAKHTICNLTMRSVGAGTDKARIRADFLIKNPADDWVPLGNC